jgi:hypothetical protein
VAFLFRGAIRRFAILKLDGGVLDPETLVQFIGDPFEQLIIQLRFTFHHMRRAGRFGGA